MNWLHHIRENKGHALGGEISKVAVTMGETEDRAIWPWWGVRLDITKEQQLRENEVPDAKWEK